jgi:malonate transporter
MAGVLIGFAIIAFIILVGYIVGRIGILGPTAGFVLGRVVFFVLSPCLLFTVLASAKVSALFSSRWSAPWSPSPAMRPLRGWSGSARRPRL